MSSWESSRFSLSDRDLAFVIEAVSPEISDKANLKRIIREDEDFRNSFISDETVFRKLMDDVFRTPYENFLNAKKPLNFISEHYLQYKRQMIFA